MRFIRKYLSKPLSVFVLVNLLATMVPTTSFALTGGPSSPETQGFQQVGTSDMVDLFTGDFSYNIPLMDVGGYPINLAYSSGVTSDMEASWVGLGWSLNPGAVNRSVRGIPDDFKGDPIKREYYTKPQIMANLGAGTEIEFAAIEIDKLKEGLTALEQVFPDSTDPNDPEEGELVPKIKLTAGVAYSNYTGLSLSYGVTPSLSANLGNKGTLNGGLGLSNSSAGGVGIDPNISFSKRQDETEDAYGFDFKLGTSFNSREGLSEFTFGIDDTRDAANGGFGTSSAFNAYARPTRMHNTSMPTFKGSTSFEAALGTQIFAADIPVDLDGAISVQGTASNRTQFGYGYFYEEQAGKFGLKDFTRGGDGPVNEKRPYLPVVTHTNDIFNISGQGVGGSYRAFRHDIGVLHDPASGANPNESGSFDFALELGGGAGAKGGAGIAFASSLSKVGIWETTLLNRAAELAENEGLLDEGIITNAQRSFAFREKTSRLDDETFYLNQAGDRKIDTDFARYERLGEDKATKIKIKRLGIGAYATSTLENSEGTTQQLLSNESVRSERIIRNQPVSTLDAFEANKSGYSLQNDIYALNENSFEFDATTQTYSTDRNGEKISRLTSEKKAHHLSEIKVTREDGARYIYGIPVYNNFKEEITFSVGAGYTPDCSTGLVEYDQSDIKRENENGKSHLYDKTTTPAHATSYLLTAVLSSDYIDLTGDGPTPDDLGSYTRFNYSKNEQDYKWRTPFPENQAKFNSGLLSTSNDYATDQNSTKLDSKISDDNASIIHGEKEMYYLHSIETKTHVAEFTIGSRLDAAGSNGLNGGFDGTLENSLKNGSKKLERIDLFTKEEKINEETIENYQAVPIKSVHFRYDYTLCQGIENSITQHNNYNVDNASVQDALDCTIDKDRQNAPRGGKLTLKEVFFTYENSFKGVLNKYKFNYDQTSNNPYYNNKAYDRWGCYKAPTGAGRFSCLTPESEPGVEEFPYVLQDKATTDRYAQAWLMKKIELPSGGSIEVDYESDSYSHVQDKAAMQMFKVTGARKDLNNINNESELNEAILYGDRNENMEYIFFELQEPFEASSSFSIDEANDYVRSHYNRGIEDLYFKFSILVNPDENRYDYVPGYAKLAGNKIGVVDKQFNGEYKYGYIQLQSYSIGFRERETDGDKAVNPMAKAGFHFVRQYLPHVAYQQSLPDDTFGKQVAQSMVSLIKNQSRLVTGINRDLRTRNVASKFDNKRSVIRLHNPNGRKLGGGCRVKAVRLNDNWGSMSGENTDAQYGQEYDYTTEVTINGKKETISSGVASYEPMMGGEENPFRQPIPVGDDNQFLVPGTGEYLEEPLGESYFPGASVGYSKVTVRNLDKTDLGEADRRRTGKTVHEFYTCKDFPTIVDRTSMSVLRTNPFSPMNFFKLVNFDFFAASQGYSIELNNMHGKQKSQRIYAQGSNVALSGVDYNYLVDEEGQITNKVPVLGASSNQGKITTANIGLEYDVVADMRESTDLSNNVEVDFDIDAFVLGIVPVLIPTGIPALNFETSKYQSATMVKVINRNAILKETIAYDLGAQISTKNEVWDAKTGNVLLTKTKNSFNDEVYSFNYPAHWAYDRMGFAYKNIGLSRNVADNANWVNETKEFLVLGDELGVTYGRSSTERVWVTKIDDAGIELKNREGLTIPTDQVKDFIILRSGRRNMQAASIGAVTTLKSPLIDNTGDGVFDEFDYDFTEVLDASATRYRDDWKVYCTCDIDPTQNNFNPFAEGALGNFKAFKSYLHLTERTQTWVNNNTNIRKDGVFESFQPFWFAPTSGTGVWDYDEEKWQFTTEITQCDPYGFELENRDALGRYSGAIYGYRNTLPIAVANNSRHREIAFDNFEDYLENSEECIQQDHFSFKANKENRTDEVSHSGRYSIGIGSGESVSVKKDLKPCSE